MLKGQAKTEVEVKVRRHGKKEDIVFKIKREKISISNVTYYNLVDPEIGYIKLDDFTPGAAREVFEAMEELKEKGAKKIILDLRDNPGGLLHEAVNIVSLFVPKGSEVVSTKGKAEDWNKKYNTLNAPADLESPMVVLTSGGSASAAEIVAGSLQDYDRAVLVGEKTFGKGLVQTTRPLSYNAQLKVTTAKYYIPSGRCIQALDYTHRKDDGTVEKFADSLKAEFKTKGGRKVYDGGGLDPDVEIQNELLGPVAEALLNAGLIFEYASKYCSENQAQTNLSSFKLSDNEFENFVSWTKEQKFQYTTSLEKSAKELMEAARKERFYPELENELVTLKSKIEANKANELLRFKTEISELLQQQIAFHYELEKGLAEVSLHQDREIQEAKRILGDSMRYKKILSRQEWP
jgi:carboxyl-terminal processing protease